MLCYGCKKELIVGDNIIVTSGHYCMKCCDNRYSTIIKDLMTDDKKCIGDTQKNATIIKILKKAHETPSGYCAVCQRPFIECEKIGKHFGLYFCASCENELMNEDPSF